MPLNSHSQWAEEMLGLSLAVELWNLVRIQDVDELAKMVKSDESDPLTAGVVHLGDWLTTEIAKGRLEVRYVPIGVNPPSFVRLVVPSDLRTWLWLQFAEAVRKNTAFNQCGYCCDWFEIRPPATRKSRGYCSESCRSKAYRKRKKAKSVGGNVAG